MTSANVLSVNVDDARRDRERERAFEEFDADAERIARFSGIDAPTLRARYDELRAERQSLPDPADATSQRERDRRDATLRRLKNEERALWGALQTVEGFDRKLAKWRPMVEALKSARTTLRRERTECEERVSALDTEDPSRRNSGLARRELSEISLALAAITEGWYLQGLGRPSLPPDRLVALLPRAIDLSQLRPLPVLKLFMAEAQEERAKAIERVAPLLEVQEAT